MRLCKSKREFALIVPRVSFFAVFDGKGTKIINRILILILVIY